LSLQLRSPIDRKTRRQVAQAFVFERATQRRAVPITVAELEACSVIIGAKR
jgi:hypothetical protein